MKSYDEIIAELKTNLETISPDILSTYAIQLAMYTGFLGEQVAVADSEYNKKWEEFRIVCDTDGQADKKSKATTEYFNKKMLEAKLASTKELINAIKRRLGVLSDELKLQR